MSAPQKKKKTTKSKDSIETSVEENKTETILEVVEISDNVVIDNVVTDNVLADNVVTDNTTILDPNQIIEEIKEEIIEEIKEKIDEVITVQIPVNLVDLVKE